MANVNMGSRQAAPGTARRRSRWKTVRRTIGLTLAVVVVLAWWFILRIEEHPSWPPPTDAVTPAQAQAMTEAFIARERVRASDIAIPYAPTTAADVQLFIEGANFFPAILTDIRAAKTSVHVLEFGFRPGEIGDQFVAALEQKVREGVEVRVIVDSYGSGLTGGSAEMYAQLANAGVQIVAYNTFPLDRDGLLPSEATDWRNDEVGQSDHRKMFVIDGTTGWMGGAGIEDHFATGEFHDVFVRVEGDIVRQMQAVFLTSFRALGGSLPPVPGGLAKYFPAPADPGTIPTTLLQNVPGGYLAGTQATRAAIEGAKTRIDIMNPYLSDDGMLDRIVAAGERGAAVRILVPDQSNNAPAQYALEHNYGRLLEAGAEIWEYPTIMHAKVLVADDITIVGTINLDAWALYRNHEIALRFESREIGDQVQQQWVVPDIARSAPGQQPTGAWTRFRNWVWSGLAYFV